MKIKVLLSGGLGNQMFQYSFAKALSIHYNCELLIDSTLIYSDKNRRYMLFELFGINETNDDRDNYITIQENEPYTDDCEHKYFNLDTNHNYRLSGYWQNENFFKNFESQIREDFYLEPIDLPENSMIVQIRRGDFVKNKSHEYCDINWYNEAIEEIKRNSNIENIFFSSDDLDWCEDKFSKLDNKRFIEGDEKTQFRHFYGCKNFVISNSSFGWWGAWYSDTSNVVCPKVWFPANLKWNTARTKWKKK